VFQPHRYSRTKSLFNDFVDVLCLADEVILLEIYAAGEAEINGINSAKIVESVIDRKHNKIHLLGAKDIETILQEVVEDGDVILMQGAGTIGQMAINLVHKKTG